MSSETSKKLEIKEGVGQSLLNALTATEIGQILEALLRHLSPTSLEAVLAQLPNDTQHTLQKLINRDLSDSSDPPAEPLSSLAKCQQRWSNLWEQWQDMISEAKDDEDGKYLEQEEDWEPPYFDDETFIEDLEDIAQKMQPLLRTAYEHLLTPQADFAQELAEMSEEITDALPKWIISVNEGFYLKQELTRCFLQWQWWQTQDKGQNAFVFLQEMREWEEKTPKVHLNSDTFLDFLNQTLSDDDWQHIYEGLTAHQEDLLWKTALQKIHSHWHHINLHCLEKYAPEHHLSLLRATIPQKWHNGLVVIEDLLKKKAYQEGLTVVQETIASLLSSFRREQTWNPEEVLLVALSAVRYSTIDFPPKKTLLGYYHEIVTALGQKERAEALQLQLIAVDHCFDWSIMLEAFENTKASPTAGQSLYQSWCHYILKTTYYENYEENKTRENPEWLTQLLNHLSPFQPTTEAFPTVLERWLEKMESDPTYAQQYFRSLRLLTQDLADIYQEDWQHWSLFRTVVLRTEQLKTVDALERQRFLQPFVSRHLWEKIIAYWQNNLILWIPKPETARNSDYREQATWMSALREVSPSAYQSLLAQWRINHKRRRNLWKTMEQKGLN